MMIEQAFDSWHAEPMAGGMRGKHGPPGLTLAERSQLSGIGAAGAASSRRHCWVVGPNDAPGPFPGLVLDWRRHEDGTWCAYVIYVVDGLETAVQAWVPAARLQPAGH